MILEREGVDMSDTSDLGPGEVLHGSGQPLSNTQLLIVVVALERRVAALEQRLQDRIHRPGMIDPVSEAGYARDAQEREDQATPPPVGDGRTALEVEEIQRAQGLVPYPG